ncbi:acetyltransferase [Dyadobacter endophyticus]|uniref:Acetyltransferase n=1 Tax=Dyadobacter endophyticus TaxID=1749036 RepID=A0ABQ1Z7E3_9BACT|nr:acetyltransferase [Dyadobacter endophyticus]GGH52318.1 acetyltransferase [Dyadobacter endophyticus]
MLIYGAGGHAKVVASILSACEERVVGLFDDDWQNVIWPDQCILHGYDPLIMPIEKLIIAIGGNQARRQVAEKVVHSFGLAIHPTALVDRSVRVGTGVVIVHNTVVQAGGRIGDHVIINTAAIVDHECILGNFAHIGPGATICGGVRVGECSLVGAGSVVLPGVSIGKECIIGAGSVVTRNVPDYAKVAGNPARNID